jgi:hypothetical protein
MQNRYMLMGLCYVTLCYVRSLETGLCAVRQNATRKTSCTNSCRQHHELGGELNSPGSLLCARSTFCSTGLCSTRRGPSRSSSRTRSSASSSRGLHVLDNESCCSSTVSSVSEMRCQNDSLSRTDQVSCVADDLSVTSSDLANRLAVVWVTEDDSAVDEGCVLCGKHACGIVNELTTLTIMILASIHLVDGERLTSNQP